MLSHNSLKHKPIALALMGGKILFLAFLARKRLEGTAGNSSKLIFQKLNSKFQKIFRFHKPSTALWMTKGYIKHCSLTALIKYF
jgi:hypothetical protein